MLRAPNATSVSARPRPASKNPRETQPRPADRYYLDGEPVTLADLLAANDFDEAEIAEIKALPPGSSLQLGGGAAPLFTLTRCRTHSTTTQSGQPRSDAAGAYALLRRMTTGRWPIWRILGTAAPCTSLVVGVEWLRGAGHRYAVATIGSDGKSVEWTPCESSGDALDMLERVPQVPVLRVPVPEGRQREVT